MTQYPISLSKDYIPGWGVVDGVRELFQNALDQQTTVPGNDMFFRYDKENQLLSIGNRTSVLDPSTLLLGHSTKRGDDDTIGQFGEGYKVATLVLIREGKNVIFYNYGKKEVWRPRFVKSRKFGAEVLTFFTDRKYVWRKPPHSDLIIEVEGITEDEYKSIVESNLHLQEYLSIECDRGELLLGENHRGKVFVNGLFVCNFPEYEFGYNFKPKYIKLDRDRKLVSDFELRWLASTMWAEQQVMESMPDKLIELIENSKADVAFLFSTLNQSNSLIESVARKAYDKFISIHGTNAIPVSQGHDINQVKGEYRPVIVGEGLSKLLGRAINVDECFEPVESLKDKVSKWLESNRVHIMSIDAIEQLESILEEEQ